MSERGRERECAPTRDREREGDERERLEARRGTLSELSRDASISQQIPTGKRVTPWRRGVRTSETAV